MGQEDSVTIQNFIILQVSHSTWGNELLAGGQRSLRDFLVHSQTVSPNRGL